jgi:hypothetical protein
MERPNLIERLENLIASLNDAQLDTDQADYCIDNALGIAGELLTMIDGR